VRALGGRFARLWTAAGISNLGDGVMSAAFPLVVATLTRDPLLVAGATIASQLPWLLFAVVSGALVDRLDRRQVMIVTDLTRAVLVGVLAVAVASDTVTIPLVYVLAFGLGIAETFFDTSSEAFIPALVDGDSLPSANGRLQAVEWVGNAFAGPPIGAALFAVAAALPFGINAISFAVAAALVWSIRGTFSSVRTSKTTVRSDIAEGLGWLLRQRVLRTLSLMAGVTNLFVMGIVATFVLFAQDILGVTDLGYGALLSGLGVGGLTGAMVAPRLVARFGPGTTAQGSVCTGILVSIVMGTTSEAIVAGAMMVLYGASITAWNVVSVTLRQSLTPDRLRGRVAGAARLLAWGAQPLGAAAGGVIASAFGLRAPFFVAAGAWVVMVLVTVRIVNNTSIEDARSARPDPSASGAS
jgi:MFS family permease